MLKADKSIFQYAGKVLFNCIAMGVLFYFIKGARAQKIGLKSTYLKI